MFIGREKELAFLEKQWASPRGRMVFLYGRRRIGKTETLKAFCKDKDAIFFTASEQNAETLKRDLSRLLLATGMPASQYIETFEDWKTLFESLPTIPSSGKKLLIIDEFPYLVKADSSIASILQAVWDNALKDENIMLVFCGSSMSFIEKHILAEKNPLYGRATGIWKMGPMDFYDAVKFFPKYSPEDAVLAFSVFGGTPYYLSMLDGKLSLRDNITNTILENGAPLQTAAELLQYPGNIWMFSPQNKLVPAPSSTSQYKKARKMLIVYNHSLGSGHEIFYKNADDLAYFLKRIAADLEHSTLRLENHIRENSSSYIDTRDDDLFFYQQGKLYGYFMLTRALARDYKDIIVARDIYQPWIRMNKALEDAALLDPLIIRNGELDSLSAPNHLSVLGYYTLKAASGADQMQQRLMQGN